MEQEFYMCQVGLAKGMGRGSDGRGAAAHQHGQAVGLGVIQLLHGGKKA